MKERIENFIARCVCKGLEMYAKKRIAKKEEKESQIITIHKGDKFLCIKTVIMGGRFGYIAYIKGNTYISEKDNCITDEQGCVFHEWNTDTSTYFKKI